MSNSTTTKLFLCGVLLTGAAAFITAVARLSIAEPVKFACYCELALIAAALKVQMGGDEFVVLAPDTGRAGLDENIQRLRGAVERSGAGMGYAGLSLSVGAAVFEPSKGDVDADAILAEADRKMYANKRRRKALAVDQVSTEISVLSVH